MIFINKSSHKINEYNSCDSSNQFSCLKCDETKQRVLNGQAPSKCICNEGFYDNSNENCEQCNSYWLLFWIK